MPNIQCLFVYTLVGLLPVMEEATLYRLKLYRFKLVSQQLYHLLITGSLGSSTRTIEGIRYRFEPCGYIHQLYTV